MLVQWATLASELQLLGVSMIVDLFWVPTFD